MEHTDLSRLLSTLTKKEFKLLKKWVASPFFNQRKDVVQLLDYYLLHRKKYQKTPTKLQVFNHLFPDEPFEDHKIRMVISFLNRQIEQFLVYQKQQEKSIANKLVLLEVYREKNLKKPFQKIAKKIERIFEKTRQRNANFYRLKYLFHQEQYKAEELTKRLHHKNSLQAIADNLDINILLEKIRESNITNAHQKMITSTYDLGLFEDLIIILKEKPRYLKNPAVATHYAAYLTILHPGQETYFNTYLELLEKHEAIFDKAELLDFYNILITYFVARFNLGETKYMVDIFNTYQKKIELGLYEEQINQYAYKNTVVSGLNTKAYDWIAQFIEAYTPKLVEEQQASFYNWAKGTLARRRGQYKKALQFLQATKFEDPQHNMSARLTMTKIHYTLKEWDALQKHLKAYEIYVRRFNKYAFVREKYLEFILYAQKIFRLNPYDKKEKEQLLQTLKANPTIMEKKWLLMCLNNIQIKQ